MTRRRQVTRSDEKPKTTVRARPAGDDLKPTIYCQSVAARQLAADQATRSTAIPLAVYNTYTRTYLAATIWGCETAAAPWTLKFQCVNAPHQWISEWVLDAPCKLTAINLDATLDTRERALVHVWLRPDVLTPETEMLNAEEQWGDTYWQVFPMPGVGNIPWPISEPGYDPLRARPTIHNLRGAVHVDDHHFGPFPDGANNGLDNSTPEYPLRRLELPVDVPAGLTLGVWFEPDLTGPGTEPTWMQYDEEAHILMPAVPFTATVTFSFDEIVHDDVVITGP